MNVGRFDSETPIAHPNFQAYPHGNVPRKAFASGYGSVEGTDERSSGVKLLANQMQQ